MTYVLIYLLGSIFAFSKNMNRTAFFIFLLTILLLQAFRYGVGPDYFSYQSLYKFLSFTVPGLIGGSSDVANAAKGQEVLFQVVGFLSKSINLSFQQYVAIIGGISLYFVAKTCWKYSDNPVLSLVLYYSFFYFVWIFSGLRQGLALSIGTYYLLSCLENRQHIKFIVINTFLVLIHTSSIFLIIFYVIGNFRFSKTTMIILITISFFMQFAPGNIFQTLVEVVPFGSRVAFYTNIGGINPFDFKSLVRLFLLISFGFILPNEVFKNIDMNYKVLVLYISSFGVYYILRQSEILAQNTSIYGFVLLVVLIPNILGCFQMESNKRIFVIATLLFATFFLFKNLDSMKSYSGLQGDFLVTPYTHIFNKDSFVFVDMHSYHDK
jgi:hypothetical protein